MYTEIYLAPKLIKHTNKNKAKEHIWTTKIGSILFLRNSSVYLTAKGILSCGYLSPTLTCTLSDVLSANPLPQQETTLL